MSDGLNLRGCEEPAAESLLLEIEAFTICDIDAVD
jgi:hypothetical protein